MKTEPIETATTTIQISPIVQANHSIIASLRSGIAKSKAHEEMSGWSLFSYGYFLAQTLCFQAAMYYPQDRVFSTGNTVGTLTLDQRWRHFS